MTQKIFSQVISSSYAWKLQRQGNSHKFAPITEGPFKFKSLDTGWTTVVIIRPESSVDNVTRSRLVLAPNEPTAGDVRPAIRPVTITEIASDFPTS